MVEFCSDARDQLQQVAEAMALNAHPEVAAAFARNAALLERGRQLLEAHLAVWHVQENPNPPETEALNQHHADYANWLAGWNERHQQIMSYGGSAAQIAETGSCSDVEFALELLDPEWKLRGPIDLDPPTDCF